MFLKKNNKYSKLVNRPGNFTHLLHYSVEKNKTMMPYENMAHFFLSSNYLQFYQVIME